MYINPCFFFGLWTKINEILLKNTKKSLILSLKIWRSSSIPAASRTLGIVWGASGMITTQHQRPPLVLSALWRSAQSVCQPFFHWPFIDFSFFHGFQGKSWKTTKINKVNKNQWKFHRKPVETINHIDCRSSEGARHQRRPLMLCGNHPRSTPHYSKRPGGSRYAWGKPNLQWQN